MRAKIPSTQSTSPITAIIIAAVHFPEPVSLGFISIIFFALNALLSAIGSRMIPKQKSPMMA